MGYIVKNCPCRMSLHENDCFGHTGYYNCCACTDCVIKQVIEKCKYAISYYPDLRFLRAMAEQILQLFDIEETKE